MARGLDRLGYRSKAYQCTLSEQWDTHPIIVIPLAPIPNSQNG